MEVIVICYVIGMLLVEFDKLKWYLNEINEKLYICVDYLLKYFVIILYFFII